MLLSGIFFVSLHHQSNRMTMFKKDRSESSVRYIHGSLNAVRKSYFREAFGSFKAISRKTLTHGADCYVSLRMTTLARLNSKYAPF